MLSENYHLCFKHRLLRNTQGRDVTGGGCSQYHSSAIRGAAYLTPLGEREKGSPAL